MAHGVVGGAQAAVNGGKFLRGFASSFFRTRFDSDTIKNAFRDNKVGQVIASATVGGTISVLGGGKFANGAQTVAFVRLFKSLPGFYKKIVHYALDINPGGPAQTKGEFERPVRLQNNIGTQGELNPDCTFCEGGSVSRVLNRVPGINAVAGMHDVFQISYPNNTLRNIFNVPGMPVAAIITYSGFVGDVISNVPDHVFIPNRSSNGNRRYQLGAVSGF